jgi:hypothetical protein
MKQLFWGLNLGILGMIGWAQLVSASHPHIGVNTRLTINSFGPIHVGMTISQAEAAARITLLGHRGMGCSFVHPKQLPMIEFMLSDQRIVRFDITQRPLMTLSGAQIGDTEAKIRHLYPGILVEPHKYDSAGHYLIFKPKDLQDRRYRLLFETHRGRVTQIRAGQIPEVYNVERCG